MDIDYVTLPPDGGWGWVVVAVAFTWCMVVDGTVYSFGLFMTEMVGDFRTTPAFITLASSVQQAIYYMLGPLVAAMINRFGFRVVSMCGGVIAVGGVVGASYCTSVPAFIGTFGVVLGIAFSMIYMSNMLVVSFYFTRYRAIATSLAVTGTAVGMSVFPLIFSTLLAGLTWRKKFQYLSCAHLLMTLLGLAYKPIKPTMVGGFNTATTSLGTTLNKELPTTSELLQSQEYIIYSRPDSVSMASSHTSKLYSKTTLNVILPEISKPWKCCCCMCKYRFVLCHCLWHDSRPMYRDDILYNGSTKLLPQFNAELENKQKAALEYNFSVIRMVNASEIVQNANCCVCCPQSMTRVLFSMFDFRLFSSPAFVLLALSGFMTFLGSGLPFMFSIDQSVKAGTPYERASYVLTAIGICNGFGRIASGLLCLAPRVQATLVSEVTLLIAGVATIVHPFFRQFYVHLICSALFGLNIATTSSLRTVIIVDLIGLDNLTNAFGILILVQGIAMLIGLPLGTFLYEYSSNYIYTFLFAGVMMFLSGVVLMMVVPMRQAEKRRILRKVIRNSIPTPPTRR